MASASFSHFSTFRGPEKIPNSKTLISSSRSPSYPLLVSSPLTHLRSHHHHQISRSLSASVSTQQQISDDLVSSILSKVTDTDRGVLLTKDEHAEVAEVAQQLANYCVDEPVKCPLIFGEWDVLYCSVPTSPGGGFRSAFGRLVFKTKEMVQAVEAPETVRNQVSFSLFGFLDGDVSLKGKLIVLDDKWIQVIFEPPQLKVGSLEFQFGGKSEVKLEITYIDEKIRLGKGSRGSLFVFKRRG
ncbi:probable plastid-lipid-associated protein 8, chloroplastic [Magnolia sinica]|uniref:probable plastid-lipid-associated protein 8, chloroplastic n=1 Tax=Magnolia sinica TaxID=86752 RepID=UPI0026588169|nr:probable plastid-lipid-associated protein 8, chloroplastic [Magnolia sinica]